MRKVLSVALLAWSAAAGVGCDRAISPAEAKTSVATAHKVELGTIERGPVDRPIKSSGLVRAKQSQNLAFKVGGSLVSVAVEEGQSVKKGQTLARIDPTEYSASADQARRSVEKAERDLSRARSLAREGVVPKATLDDAETAAAVARSSVSITGFQERHTVLTAPAAGIVEARLAEPGEVVAPGRPILSFLGTDRGWVVDVSLTDKDATRARVGQRAWVKLDADEGPPIEARVGDISRIGNLATGTFSAEIVLPQALPFAPRNGLTAKVSIERRELPAAVVPLSALVDGQADSAAVFVAEDGVARRHAVRIAFLLGDKAALATDIPSAGSVVIRGAHELVDGAAVEVVPSEAGR